MILLVTPALPQTDLGNGVTAQRWADILSGLGHRVRISQTFVDGDFTALVALHAGRSAEAVRRFHQARPNAPIILALSGTDLYPDLATTGVDPAVLALADRLVVLQACGLDQLDPALRGRARVIVQSMPTVPPRPARADCFEVALLAHLRPVKDPLRLAAAVRLLPATSRVRVTHLGGARDEETAAQASAEAAANPRYEWLGARPREEALGVLARSRLLVLTSRHEGGANVISEALAAGVPVLASRIPGSVGLLGTDHPGYFPTGDTAALAAALDAAEHDRGGYYRALKEHCSALRPLVHPGREQQAWAELLAELESSVSL